MVKQTGVLSHVRANFPVCRKKVVHELNIEIDAGIETLTAVKAQENSSCCLSVCQHVEKSTASLSY